eukprot:142689-Karenia_brevis.AAC.1
MAAQPGTVQTHPLHPRLPSTVHTTYSMNMAERLHAAGLEDVHTPAQTAQHGLGRPLREDPVGSGSQRRASRD